ADALVVAGLDTGHRPASLQPGAVPGQPLVPVGSENPLEPFTAEVVEACGTDVGGLHRDLTSAGLEQCRAQQGEQLAARRACGVELPHLLDLTVKSRQREPVGPRLDERLARATASSKCPS